MAVRTAVERPALARGGSGSRPGALPAERHLPVRSIGPYRLVELLGEGGMGSVYLAEQKQPIERRVAIKLIQSRFPGREAVYRFEAERRALARMNHPNIAQVFEAGSTEDGQPYLVMELVDGAPITRHCDERRLSIEARLDLFLNVCDGIHHAHQKGVLHRDIKPSNVLVAEVEGRPVPKIIDFGIAKAMDEAFDDERLTRAGRVVGTPSYLSPEAVLATPGSDVDIRSDVHSLGILLFELLVGEVPFARGGTSLAALVASLSTEEAERPSRRFAGLGAGEAEARADRRSSSPAAVLRSLRGDLDWIVLKAMAREREERYRSVAALAGDLERCRRFEPVEARPPSWSYLTRRFVRRNKLQVGAAAIVLVALVAGLVARTQEAARANREAARANREAAVAREVADFLTTLFEVSDPSQSRGSSVTARELLDRGAAQIADRFDDQPATRARLMQVMGGVYRGLGLNPSAAELLESAVEELEALGEGYELELATARQSLGLVRYAAGEYAAAGELYGEVLDVRRRLLGENHPDTADVLGRLGDLYEVQGMYREALPLLRRALAIREQTLPEDHPDRAENLERLGIVLTRLGEREEGEAMLRESLALRRRVLGPDHPHVALTLNNLAIARAEAGDLEGAQALFEEALELRRRIFTPDHPDIGQSLINLGMVHEMQGDLEEAERFMSDAERVWSATLGERHPRVLKARSGLAGLAEQRGELERADEILSEVLALPLEALGGGSGDVAATLENLARVRLARGDAPGAVALLERSLANREARLPPTDELVTRTRDQLTAARAALEL